MGLDRVTTSKAMMPSATKEKSKMKKIDFINAMMTGVIASVIMLFIGLGLCSVPIIGISFFLMLSLGLIASAL